MRAEEFNEFGKFVRLKLIDEIVEVVGVNSTEIAIKFYGNILTMKHHEVSRVTPEEESTAASQIEKSEKRSWNTIRDEGVYIVQNGKKGGGPNFK
jgi:hypothetical protein